jgi:hypothetical protein
MTASDFDDSRAFARLSASSSLYEILSNVKFSSYTFAYFIAARMFHVVVPSGDSKYIMPGEGLFARTITGSRSFT